MGTDDVGRDMLSRLIHGARVSLSVAIFVQMLILLIGLTIGGAGWLFRWPHRQLADALHRRVLRVS